MTKFYLLIINVIFVLSLAGCGAASVALLVLSLPVGVTHPQQVEIPGYTLGPVSSDEFPALLHNAIPASEGDIYFTGRAQWTGLENVNQPSGKLIQSIVAITDFQILFLWWREQDERYEILILLPYSEIYSVDLKTPGFGALIKFCHKDDEIRIGDQNINIDQETSLNFLGDIFGDAEKTKKVFVFLDKKITRKEGLEHLQSPCENDLESDTEHQGFNEDNVTEGS